MANDIKRLNYFTGQFLEALDFQDEQRYHIEMRRRLNRLIYSPGVVDNGFSVTKTGDKRISVGTGFAIDGTGSELFIITPQEKDISGFAANAVVYVALHYAEATLDADKRTSDKENISGFIRITESPDIKFLANAPSGEQAVPDILIAKLQLDASGNIQSIDTSQRLMANLRIGSGRLGIGTFAPGAKLQIDGANDKTDAVTAESQWLRMRNNVTNKADAKWGIAWDAADSVSPQAYIMANADYKSNYDTSLVFGTRDATANTTERMRITASGNIGIGITSPSQKLIIAGAQNAGKDPDSGMSGGGQLAIKGNAPQLDFIDTDAKDWSIHVNDNRMYFIREPWNYSDLVLDGTGKVGMGTATPGAKLEITGTLTASQNNESLIGLKIAPTFDDSGKTGVKHNGLIITDGNVGIGTMNPTGKLTVAGSKGDSRSVTIDNSEIKFRGDTVSHISILGPDTDKNYLSIANTASNGSTGIAGTNLMVITNNGDVGIGIPGPNSKLHIDKGRVDITSSDLTGGGGNRFDGLHPRTTNGRSQLVLSSNYSDMVIASSQVNHKHGSTLTFVAYNTDNTKPTEYRKWVINQGNWGDRKQFLDFGFKDADNVKNPHDCISPENTVLTLDGVNKRVGIGDITPASTLSIKGSLTITGNSIDNPGNVYFGTQTRQMINLWGTTNYGIGVQDGTQYFRSDSNFAWYRGGTHEDRELSPGKTGQLLMVIRDGNIGIGTENPKMPLHVRQSGIHQGILLEEVDSKQNATGRFMQIAYEGQGNIHFYHQSGVGQWMDPSGNWNKNSDLILKKDISALPSMLDKVLQLNPVQFRWKANQTQDIGFIAQEVEKVFPELVNATFLPQDPSQKIKGLSYTYFGIVSIAAIKELKAYFDEQLAVLEQKLENKTN